MNQLISDDYLKQQKQLHQEKEKYGTIAKQYVSHVLQLADELKTQNILDYGCGKGALQQNIPFKIKQYDPAVLEYSHNPEPADIVVCADVLEHIEPEYLDNVLNHLIELVKVNGFFIIDGTEAKKTLPDGRNAHLIVESGEWWFNKLSNYFTVLSYHLSCNVEDGKLKAKKYVFLVSPTKE